MGSTGTSVAGWGPYGATQGSHISKFIFSLQDWVMHGKEDASGIWWHDAEKGCQAGHVTVTPAAAWPHSITPRPGQIEQQITAHTARPGLTRSQERRGRAAVLGCAEACWQGSCGYASVTRWSCISMNKLLFVTKSAQIQAPHPPTLRKVISKSASEPEPPAIAVVPSPHAPHYAQRRVAPSPSMLCWGWAFKFGKPEVFWPQCGQCSRLLLAVPPQFPAGKGFCVLAGGFFWLAIFSCLVSDGLKAPRDFGKLACAETNLLFTEIQLWVVLNAAMSLTQDSDWKWFIQLNMVMVFQS